MRGKFFAKAGALGLDDVPQSLLEGISELFGEALTPMQVVERIVRRVRDEGDAAVRDFCVAAGWRCARRIRGAEVGNRGGARAGVCRCG